MGQLWFTRVTVEGRHVRPPLRLVFDCDGFDINWIRHNQSVEIAPGLEVLVTSTNIRSDFDELDSEVEDAATFERILAWVKSGEDPDVRLVSAPVPSDRAG